MAGRDTGQDTGGGWRRRFAAGLITAVGVGLAGLHVARPALKIDAITVALLAVAALPWIGGRIENIEFPGGLKVQLRKVEQDVLAIRDEVGSAASTATAALAAATTAPGESTLDELVAEFARVRTDMPSGPLRTAQLDAVVGRMIVEAGPLADFDWRGSLSGPSEGRQIAGVAYATARPDPAMLDALLDLAESATSYVVYWTIRAIGGVIAKSGRPEPAVRRRLHALATLLPAGSGRAQALSSLLRRLD